MPVGIFALADASDARELARAASKGELPGAVVLHGMCLIDLVTLAHVVDPSSDQIRAIDGAIRVSQGAAVPVSPELQL